MQALTFKNMNYLLKLPSDYREGERYPVLLFLHGAGTRGNDIELLKSNPFFIEIEKHESFPFVIVAPQCHLNSWFDLFEHLRDLVAEIYNSPYTDRERIYLMGNSMGGYGTWQLAMSLPNVFAAAVPICGGGMYWNARRLADLPVWAFHGEKDTEVLPEESKKMVEAVRRSNGEARLTLYAENGHDAWTDTYRNKEVFDWLLSHRRLSANDGTDPFYDSRIYE